MLLGPDLSSSRKLSEFIVNLLLLSVVLVCWWYVVYAGRVATLRYLDKLDFSDQVERVTVLQLLESVEGNISNSTLRFWDS